MKQIYPITVVVLAAITVCCSAIGVRRVAAKSSPNTTISQTSHAATIVASGE